MERLYDIYTAIESMSFRSKWDKGVKRYALELIENAVDNMDALTWDDIKEGKIWNGADGVKSFSYGGDRLIWDGDIANRLLTASELKKWNAGKWNGPEMIVLQTRALVQAWRLIKRTHALNLPYGI